VKLSTLHSRVVVGQLVRNMLFAGHYPALTHLRQRLVGLALSPVLARLRSGLRCLLGDCLRCLFGLRAGRARSDARVSPETSGRTHVAIGIARSVSLWQVLGHEARRARVGLAIARSAPLRPTLRGRRTGRRTCSPPLRCGKWRGPSCGRCGLRHWCSAAA